MYSVPVVSIRIVGFVDSHQPGFVACELLDAQNRTHTFVDKVPVFTDAPLDGSSVYPQPGVVNCEVLSRWRDEAGRQLARITTARPYDVDSTEGISEFVVLAEQVTRC